MYHPSISCASNALGGNWQFCHMFLTHYSQITEMFLRLHDWPHKPLHWGSSLPVNLALCLHLCTCTLPGLVHSSHRVLGGLYQLTRQLAQALGILGLCFRPVTTKTVAGTTATILIQQVPHCLSLMTKVTGG